MKTDMVAQLLDHYSKKLCDQRRVGTQFLKMNISLKYFNAHLR